MNAEVPAADRAFIGLGANLAGPLGKPQDYIQAALERLSGHAEIFGLKHSPLYRSRPWGRTDQDDYVNAAAVFTCSLAAVDLLALLLATETALGRVRGEKWGPRLIDIDLLSYGDRVIDRDDLVLPHPWMHQRAFVLKPLLDLDPDYTVAGRGRADALLARLHGAKRANELEPL